MGTRTSRTTNIKRKISSNAHEREARGFTLIELLVVIAIIGLLSAVVLAALNTAREKSYDAERFSDLQQVQTAVNAYYADNGNYPITSGTHFYSNCNGGPFSYKSANNVIPGLAPTYIPSVPVGPQEAVIGNVLVDCYAYMSTSNGSDYKFMDYSNPPISQTIAGAKTPSGTLEDPNYTTNAWSVYSPGGALGL